VNLTEIRELAHRIADIADGRTMRWFRGGLDVRMKADGSMVTEVDEHVETMNSFKDYEVELRRP
jgi:fructose-1,6-bisphosphatase/inositol monophosphatase family enzyme